jgi:hypothetical protein
MEGSCLCGAITVTVSDPDLYTRPRATSATATTAARPPAQRMARTFRSRVKSQDHRRRQVEGIQRLEDAERNTVSRFFAGIGKWVTFLFKANISRWHVLYLDGPPPIRSQPQYRPQSPHNTSNSQLTSPSLSPVPSNPSPLPHRQNDPQMRPVPANPAAGSGELRDTAPEMGGAVWGRAAV